MSLKYEPAGVDGGQEGGACDQGPVRAEAHFDRQSHPVRGPGMSSPRARDLSPGWKGNEESRCLTGKIRVSGISQHAIAKTVKPGFRQSGLVSGLAFQSSSP